MTLYGTVWYGVAVVSLVIAIWAIIHLVVVLRGRGPLKALITVFLGVLAGCVGMLVFIWLDDFTDFFFMIYEYSITVRTLIYAPIIFIFPVIFGFAAAHLLRFYCPPKGVRLSSVLMAATLVGYPVWWQWLTVLAVFFTGPGA